MAMMALEQPPERWDAETAKAGAINTGPAVDPIVGSMITAEQTRIISTLSSFKDGFCAQKSRARLVYRSHIVPSWSRQARSSAATSRR
jgi:hypothetical protein